MASNRKFMSALNALCEEKGIEKDVFLEMLKESIAKAYKKNYMVPEANVRVEINEKTGKIRLFEIRTVVDDLEDEDLEVSLDEAHDINPNYQVGDIVETEADVDHIGRLAAIQTKQLFRQKIRETEKETLYKNSSFIYNLVCFSFAYVFVYFFITNIYLISLNIFYNSFNVFFI